MGESYKEFPPSFDRRARHVLGRARKAYSLGKTLRKGPGLQQPAIREVVPRRADEPLLQRRRPPRGGGPDRKALVYVSTEINEERIYSYKELLAEVNRFAAILQELGVGKGDRVLIYMPMVAEAVFAMLATVRLGAIHSVVFGGFASNSLATASTMRHRKSW